MANHYATLGVERDATSYRRTGGSPGAHHPDAGGDTAGFLEIQAAYDVLGVVPAIAAAVVCGTHGPVLVLLFGLAATLVCGKVAWSLAGTEAERVRRHRQFWMHGFVLPDVADREHAARCERLAAVAKPLRRLRARRRARPRLPARRARVRRLLEA